MFETTDLNKTETIIRASGSDHKMKTIITLQ